MQQPSACFLANRRQTKNRFMYVLWRDFVRLWRSCWDGQLKLRKKSDQFRWSRISAKILLKATPHCCEHSGSETLGFPQCFKQPLESVYSSFRSFSLTYSAFQIRGQRHFVCEWCYFCAQSSLSMVVSWARSRNRFTSTLTTPTPMKIFQTLID